MTCFGLMIVSVWRSVNCRPGYHHAPFAPAGTTRLRRLHLLLRQSR